MQSSSSISASTTSLSSFNVIVKLNVGGREFATSLQTLTKFSSSMLARMFSGEGVPACKDDQGRYFIDRDPTHFEKILNFLRDGICILPENNYYVVKQELLQEAKYYSLTELIEYLENYDDDSPSQAYKDTMAKLLTQSDIGNEIESLKKEFLHKFSIGLPYVMERAHPFFPSRKPNHLPLVLHALERDGFYVEMKKERGKFGWFERLIFRWIYSKNTAQTLFIAEVGDFRTLVERVIHYHRKRLKVELPDTVVTEKS